jgi:ribosomal protein L17
LTEIGKDVYQSQKTIYKAKNLKEYLQNLVQAAKTQKFAEPFDTILKNLGKSSS